CPASVTVPSTAGTCGAAVIYATPAGTDRCSSATTAQTAGAASGAVFPIGTTLNTFRVTDAAGNPASCSFSVTVVDAEAPTIACPANVTVPSTPGTCGAAVGYAAPVGSDRCSGATTVQTAGSPSGSAFPLGTTSNTFQATDGAGNAASCSFTVTVVDAEPPTIACPANVTVPSTPGACGAVVTYAAPVGADRCSATTTAQTAGAPSGGAFP